MIVRKKKCDNLLRIYKDVLTFILVNEMSRERLKWTGLVGSSFRAILQKSSSNVKCYACVNCVAVTVRVLSTRSGGILRSGSILMGLCISRWIAQNYMPAV